MESLSIEDIRKRIGVIYGYADGQIIEKSRDGIYWVESDEKFFDFNNYKYRIRNKKNAKRDKKLIKIIENLRNISGDISIVELNDYFLIAQLKYDLTI